MLAWFPLSVISRRAYRRLRSVFINEINAGGLPLLNQMVLETSGFEITSVMKLIADEANLPTALFCTAGNVALLLPFLLIMSMSFVICCSCFV